MSLVPCEPGQGRTDPATGPGALGHLAMAAALLLLVMLCGAPVVATATFPVLAVAAAAAEPHGAASQPVHRDAGSGHRSRPVATPPGRGADRAPIAARHRQLPPIRAP